MHQTDHGQAIGRRAWLRTVGVAAAGLAVPGTVSRAQQDRSPIDWRSDFPALNQRVNGKPLAYLDSAATTLRPVSVIDAVSGFYRTVNANPSATLHTLARQSAEAYAAARATVARFINADPREIVFTRGTTESINLFAASWGTANLRPGDEILLSVAEHYSNWLPWRAAARRRGATVRVFGVHDDGRLNLEEMERLLSRRTRLVAVSQVSNVLGLINPIGEVVRRAKSVNARVLVDGAQSAPHVPVDVKAADCDFFVFSSHKMLGPMATGVAWARHDILEAMPPYQTGSNMAHDVTFDSEVLEHDGQKFQAGTPNVSGPIGLAAACAYLDGLSRTAIAAHERTLTVRALDVLGRVRGLKLIGSATSNDRVPVFCFTIDGVAVPAIVKALDEDGIAIRGGDMAALPLLERFGTKAAARVSCYLYTTVEDIDRLGAVLERLKG